MPTPTTTSACCWPGRGTRRRRGTSTRRPCGIGPGMPMPCTTSAGWKRRRAARISRSRTSRRRWRQTRSSTARTTRGPTSWPRPADSPRRKPTTGPRCACGPETPTPTTTSGACSRFPAVPTKRWPSTTPPCALPRTTPWPGRTGRSSSPPGRRWPRRSDDRSMRPGVLAAAFVLASIPVAAAERFGARVVQRDEILQAMKPSRGYNLMATTNGPRFQAEVLLRLASDAEARDPRRQPLFVGHREWFEAYLERTGLTRDRAPLFVRLADEYGQEAIVDYRRDRVLTGIPAVNAPLRALNVCIWWPEREGGPKSYSYEDTLSTPQLKVTNERVITYRLLDYRDIVVFNEVTGLRGRPTTGILGMLFQLIGEGNV